MLLTKVGIDKKNQNLTGLDSTLISAFFPTKSKVFAHVVFNQNKKDLRSVSITSDFFSGVSIPMMT